MITYEVTVEVRPDLWEAFERFMIDRHIPDLMATGCFASASMSRSEPGRYRARYDAHDRQALNRYMNEHALRLRRHVAESFPEGLSFQREEWEVLANF
jgi:hypothetical protein